MRSLIYDYFLNNELKSIKSAPKIIPIPIVNPFNLSQQPTLSHHQNSLHILFIMIKSMTN